MSAGHLIHRGAVPLPLKGKDNCALQLRLDLQCRALFATADLIHRKRSPFPYEGKALTHRKVGETSSIAASEALPRCPAKGSAPPGGWVGGVYPSAQIQGADSGFRRTYGFHPRRAKRRAQVCGDSTVQNNGCCD